MKANRASALVPVSRSTESAVPSRSSAKSSRATKGGVGFRRWSAEQHSRPRPDRCCDSLLHRFAQLSWLFPRRRRRVRSEFPARPVLEDRISLLGSGHWHQPGSYRCDRRTYHLQQRLAQVRPHRPFGAGLPLQLGWPGRCQVLNLAKSTAKGPGIVRGFFVPEVTRTPDRRCPPNRKSRRPFSSSIIPPSPGLRALFDRQRRQPRAMVSQ